MPAGHPARPPEAPRLRTGVVSAGKVGAVLGAALQRAGHGATAVAAVSRASLARAEALLPGVPVRPPDEVAANADLVVLAVPDDVLPGLVRGLVAAGSLRSGQIVLHTCGSRGVDVLAPAAEVGALPLALHPAMTFTGRSEDLERLATACAAITAADGDEASWSVGEALAVELGLEPVRVPESARVLYHAALAHGSNHLVTLVNDCVELLHRAGVDSAERVVAPMLSAALDNALRFGPRAITGPVSRGDAGTVRAHLAAFEGTDAGVVPAYVALARRTAERAVRSGVLREDEAVEVREALDEER